MKIWSKIKKGANWLWEKTNGGKTAVGVGLHLLWAGANWRYFNLPLDTNIWIHTGVIGPLTGVGVGHKWVKNKNKINKVINIIKSLKK